MRDRSVKTATLPNDGPRGVLLGPQHPSASAPAELGAIHPTGRIALITAGWQEREAEDDDDLEIALGGRTINLRLHARCEEVFARDPELFAEHRARQDRLRQLQDVYRLRLDHALDAARALFDREGPADLLDPERDSAVEAIRQLDAWHLQRIREVHADFERRVRPGERPALAQHRAEILAITFDSVAIAMAGGHVSTLLNRLRLLDVARCLRTRPVVAWSGGAMVLTERVVLFHDRVPEGPGNPEVLDAGLGLFPGIVALPDATRRLRTDDLTRMRLMSRRFTPCTCVALDPGGRLGYEHGRWTPGPATRGIDSDGRLVALEPWAAACAPPETQPGRAGDGQRREVRA